MALNIVDTTYPGTYASQLIMLAMYGMDTVDKKCIAVHGDIKKAHSITRLQFNNPLSPRQDFPISPEGDSNYTIDGRLLTPQSVDIWQTFNPRDFETDQYAEMLQDTIIDRAVPNPVQDAIVFITLQRAAEQYENTIWMGSTSYQTAGLPVTDPRYQVQWFNGFFQRWVNDSLVNLSSISPVTITIANIKSIMDDLISQVGQKNKALIANPVQQKRMRFLVSINTSIIWAEYLRTGSGTGTDSSFKGNPYDVDGNLAWGGYKVVPLAGFPDNSIAFCKADDDLLLSGLHAGVNSTSDWQLKIKPIAPFSESWGLQAKFKWDIQYGWAQEIFLYTTLTPSYFTLPVAG